MNDSVASTALSESADTFFTDGFAEGRTYSPHERHESPSRPMCGDAQRLSSLMERYAAGEESVFDELYALLAPPLYSFCLRLTLRASEADDCFQETFLRLHRSRATYMPGANALHWAFAIARSAYLTRLRYWRRRPEQLGDTQDVCERDALLPADGASPESETLAAHMLSIVSEELGKMSEKNRSAYILLKEENMSARDAAIVLGTTTNVVKQRAHRAYEQLRAALHAAGWGEHGHHA